MLDNNNIRTMCNRDFLAEHHPLKNYLDSLPDRGRPEFLWGDFVVRRFGEAGIEILGPHVEYFIPDDGHVFAYFPIQNKNEISFAVERQIRKAAYEAAMAERTA